MLQELKADVPRVSTIPNAGPELDDGIYSVRLEDLSWSSRHEASNDFRSDYCTTPTLDILESNVNTSLGGDVTQEVRTTN
jgi:hypothetical protein